MAELGSGIPQDDPRPVALVDRAAVLALIDQTLLRPDATPAEVEAFCSEAAGYGFGHVCVNGVHVARAAAIIGSAQGDGGPVDKCGVCSVVGFPLGAMSPRSKLSEAAAALEDGAAEIDMVIDIGALLGGDVAAVEADIAGVVRVCDGRAVKVILETCYLDDEQKLLACSAALAAGASFVKTSTGFGSAGATVEDVRLMNSAVSPRLGVKASGGVRDFETLVQMVDAGATRIGTSNGPAILAGFEASGLEAAGR